MKSYWINPDDGQRRVTLREVDSPIPGSGQVLVQLHAAALNRGEFISGHGLHATGKAKSAGMEGAGRIVQLGTDVVHWQVGDRVMGRCPGAFSEFALMDVREMMPVPDVLTWEEAAAVPLTFLVAYDLLVLQGQLKAGQWVLINGVTSGVGVACLQLAQCLGAQVVGTSGSQAKLDALAALGLNVAVCTRAPDFFDAVMQATDQQGVSLVVNTVGGSVLAESLRCMAFQGRMGIVGYVDGRLSAEVDLETLHAQRLVIFGVSNKHRTPAQRAEGVAQFAEQVLPALADGRIRVKIDRTFEFGQLDQAIEFMQANQHTGKIALRMPVADVLA